MSIAEGRSLYEQHIGRPTIAGGVRVATKKRYRAVLDKFVEFAVTANVSVWNQVTSDVLKRYAAYLEGLGRSYNTQYLELTTLKQIVKLLISESHLPDSCKITLKLPRDHETTTYCWKDEQCEAIIQHCESITTLRWLSQVCTTLGRAGTRISELSQLRWSDINFADSLITLKDASLRTMKRQGRKGRTLKNKRGRSFPLHDEVLKTFQELDSHPDGFVFHGPKGGRLKPDTVRNFLIDHALQPLKSQFPTNVGEIGFEHGRLHSFRHFFCSCCANSNIPERVVMTWLGHADAAMVRRYYHLNIDESRRLMSRMSAQHVKASTAGDVCEKSETHPPEKSTTNDNGIGHVDS